MKFSWKVTLATLCILVASFSVGNYLLVSLSFRSALDREVTVAQEEMQLLRISYEAMCAAKGVTLENMDAVGGRVRRTLEEEPYFENHHFQIVSETGEVIYSALTASSDKELLRSITPQSAGYTIRREEKLGRIMIHCAGAVSLADGTLYLETVRDITGLFTDRETHYRVYQYLLLLVVAVSGCMLFLLSNWLTQPIRSLGSAAARLAQGDYTSRARVTGGDELAELSRSFNMMAEAIEKNVGELSAAKQRQEDFTASFVHELKTPLTSIIGYADMLRSSALPPDKQYKAASYIFSEGKRLERLSLSLMELLAVGHSAEVLPVDMQRLLGEAEKIVRPAMDARELTLTVSAQPGTIPGDGALLETLVLNLLDNARKASSPGGQVTLEGEAVPEGYRIRVTDRGRGIPAGELDRITEAFYMVDKSRSRAEGGAGLGLALCRKIAETHGGTMTFSGREGEGTRVDVLLGGAKDEE